MLAAKKRVLAVLTKIDKKKPQADKNSCWNRLTCLRGPLLIARLEGGPMKWYGTQRIKKRGY
jgi:hypothetical protein